MLKRNNFFPSTTSELSQDAFIAWLLSFAMKEHEQEDVALTQCAKGLLRKMSGMDSDEYVALIELQHKNIDVLVTLGSCFIIIDGKTFTKKHVNQIQKYKRETRKQHPGTKIRTVYYKIEDQCSKENVDLNLFRRDILEILQPYADKTDNAIFRDYVERLQQMEDEAESYRAPERADMKGWTDTMHARFFQHLKEDVIKQSLKWEKVSNHKGGFWRLWWHGLKDKPLTKEKFGFAEDSPSAKYMDDLYLQIENTSEGGIIALNYSAEKEAMNICDLDVVLCIRLDLCEMMEKYFATHSVSYQKMAFQRGTTQRTVGYVKYDMTNYKERIQAMQDALDGIVAQYHYVMDEGFRENS